MGTRSLTWGTGSPALPQDPDGLPPGQVGNPGTLLSGTQCSRAGCPWGRLCSPLQAA